MSALFDSRGCAVGDGNQGGICHSRVSSHRPARLSGVCHDSRSMVCRRFRRRRDCGQFRLQPYIFSMHALLFGCGFEMDHNLEHSILSADGGVGIYDVMFQLLPNASKKPSTIFPKTLSVALSATFSVIVSVTASIVFSSNDSEVESVMP